ncbi:putative porin [Cardinium endosymbiont of Dermatophagoides farinae]|uniref:putative porin n=1 Tax=Cardinium endosymbiont of Dermatophagoides farinae TaxID=2597823 RepID=UPI001182C138|nr:putative porin [Cardinium endosymbiont of Dermatophagoides farinae]TSJ80847.1 hypothetical protein FPG78_02195 [Cardinium endosymbiont of Dermatophagoides farinae]
MENKIDKAKKVMHKDTRGHFYLYHHYDFSKPFQLYHELHYRRKTNLFTIKQSDELLDFIAHNPYPHDASYKDHNSVVMHTFGNEIGIKGDITQPDLFYAVHYRLENIYLNYNFSQPKGIANDTSKKKAKEANEHYLGGHTRLHFAGHSKLDIDGDYLLEKGGYHKLNVAYQNNFFKLACHTVKHKVPYIVTHGYSRYRPWHKDFRAPSAFAVDTEIWHNWPHITIHPILSFKKIYNHIYYAKAVVNGNNDHCIAEPMQATTPIDLLSLGGNLNFCFFSYFHFDNNLTILKDLSSGSKIFKGYIPPCIYTGRYYYAHQPYDKKMDIETGLNIHFKELYYGDGYDIVAQQFFRQNKFAVQGRPIVDIFCNVRINNLKLSFKYSYINDFCYTEGGYFATPFYPGLKKAADIGIHWSFFD